VRDFAFLPGWRESWAAHMKQQQSASSSDEIAVFQAYTSLINSERETLWARHNALLLANSLIIGALAISPTALWENKWGALAMLGAGLLISAAWVGIAVQGWSAIRRHAYLAGIFALAYFNHLPNPFAETICNRAQTKIHHLILLVIAVFVLMYLGLGFVRLSLA
jgi:hypothetical protein